MRKEDHELLRRRVAAAVVRRYLTDAPDDADEIQAQQVLAAALKDLTLPELDNESDVFWVAHGLGNAVDGPLGRATLGMLQSAYKQSYGDEWVECPEPWKPGYFRLFGSHVTQDKDLVTAVRERLATFGVDMFVAHIDITPTAEWQSVIEQALATCDALAAFLTPIFHASRWTDQEVGWVYGRGSPVLSLMLGAAPYGFLGKTQGVRAAGLDSDEIADKVLDVLMAKPALNDDVAEALLIALEASQSFAEANERMPRLQRIASLPQNLVAPLSAAPYFNNQVRGARAVPSGMKDLLSRGN